MSASAAYPQRAKPAELARLFGVSRQAIHDQVKRKILPIDADGLIDVQLARHAIEQRVRPSAKTAAAVTPHTATPATATAEPPVNDGQLSYHVAKTLREATEAKIAQLRLAEMAGELVRAADVRASLAKRAAGLRESLLQLPARTIPLLAANPDPAAMDALLRAEIIAALAQLTSQAE